MNSFFDANEGLPVSLAGIVENEENIHASIKDHVLHIKVDNMKDKEEDSEPSYFASSKYHILYNQERLVIKNTGRLISFCHKNKIEKIKIDYTPSCGSDFRFMQINFTNQSYDFSGINFIIRGHGEIGLKIMSSKVKEISNLNFDCGNKIDIRLDDRQNRGGAKYSDNEYFMHMMYHDVPPLFNNCQFKCDKFCIHMGEVWKYFDKIFNKNCTLITSEPRAPKRREYLHVGVSCFDFYPLDLSTIPSIFDTWNIEKSIIKPTAYILRGGIDDWLNNTGDRRNATPHEMLHFEMK